MNDLAPSLLSVLLGVGLAAACGLRVFLPLFLASVFTHFHIGGLSLNAGHAWMSEWPAMIALGTATLLEVLAYYIPMIDHALDAVAVPLSTVAGTVIAMGTFVDLPTHLAWGLAIIAGGGLAGLISAGTAKTRLASSALTAGIGNPVVATAESAGAIALSVIAWFLPVVGLLFTGLVLWVVFRLLKRRRHGGDRR